MRRSQASFEYLFAIAMAFFFITVAVFYIKRIYHKPVKVAASAESNISTSLESNIQTGSSISP